MFFYVIYYLLGLSSCTPYRRGFTTSKSSPPTSDQISKASRLVSLTDENRIINSTTFQPNVFGVSFLHACDNGGLCFRIDRFEIAPNFTFNCQEKYLPIFFMIKLIDNRTDVSFGYLNPNGISIEDSQKYIHNCRKIRRYFLLIS